MKTKMMMADTNISLSCISSSFFFFLIVSAQICSAFALESFHVQGKLEFKDFSSIELRLIELWKVGY